MLATCIAPSSLISSAISTAWLAFPFSWVICSRFWPLTQDFTSLSTTWQFCIFIRKHLATGKGKGSTWFALIVGKCFNMWTTPKCHAICSKSALCGYFYLAVGGGWHWNDLHVAMTQILYSSMQVPLHFGFVDRQDFLCERLIHNGQILQKSKFSQQEITWTCFIFVHLVNSSNKPARLFL